ncbi:DNA helicase B [Conger conger]|uniref:DNA helicase B n=1 Tax=Conger conger TaxID=82655 RepID=UPI002A5AA253|nr:DNA helicase B [Conger conger]
MSNTKSTVRGRTIVGYILPKDVPEQRSDDEDSETEEEEENEPEFLDMDEIDRLSSGGQIISVSRPRRTEVVLNDPQCDRQWRVEGRFPYTEPWWEVTCRVNLGRRKPSLQGAPSYRLRSCPLPQEARSIAALFLNACGTSPDHVTKLMQWLPRERAVSLVDLLETLSEFAEGDEERKAAAKQIKDSVLNSDAGRCVQAAAAYPQVMFYLPTLLPRQFCGLVQKGGSKLAKLEELIKTDVWKLGFKSLLQEEVGLLRCEAGLEALKACGLWGWIPDLQQHSLQVYQQLKEHRRTGSTYMEMQELHKVSGLEYEPETWEAVGFLRAQGVVVQEKRFVALAEYHGYETGIAESLRHLVDGEQWCLQLDVREVLRAGLGGAAGLGGGAGLGGERELDLDQVRAAEMICANALTAISGKGGCGKTTVVSLVFGAALEQQRIQDDHEVNQASHDFQNDTGGSQSWDVPLPPAQPPPVPTEGRLSSEKRVEVLLTAPTGRAAAILTKRTKFTAYTLHQVIWSFMNWKKDQQGKLDQQDEQDKSSALQEWKFAAVRALVVDEGSLVSVQLLHSVLQMLIDHARLRKFVLLGDVRQLPSIDPGNTLHDLFHSLARVGRAIEMRTNHRAESQLIVRNASLISERNSSLDFDAVVKMDAYPTTPPPEKSFIHVILPEECTDYNLQDAVLLLLKSAQGLKDHKSSQFIAFKRKECDLINELCCKHYSQHTTRDHRNRLLFQQGDKVCCTKNGYVTDREKERELQRTLQNGEMEDKKKMAARDRLCNGEIFFITGDMTEVTGSRKRDQKRYLTLDDREGRELTVCFRELQRECRPRHAWARTIHTFQGSEAETMVYVLGKANVIQCWKHVYTAVTRGRRRVYVVSTAADLRATVRNKDRQRHTRLGELVRREFPLAGEDLNGTQAHAPCQGTPAPSQAPTQTPTPSPGPPLAPHPSSQPQRACTPATPTLPGSFRKAGAEQDAEDVAFTDAYTWSPMGSIDASCAEGDCGMAMEEAEDSTPSAPSTPSALSTPSAPSTPSTPSTPSAPSTPSTRQPGCPPSPCEGTPSKQPRLAPEESPVGSARLESLSLDTPCKGRKRIFQD